MNDQQRDRWTDGSIVSQAAAVLAEEVQSLAAGSVTKVSNLLGAGAPTNKLDVDELGKQARSLVDTFVRVLGERPGRLAQLVTPTTAVSATPDTASDATVLLLRPSQPVKAGAVATVPLRLINDHTDTDECVLVATDLIGISGYRIPASHVCVFPSPVRIGAGDSIEVRIEVRIPSATPAGHYTGLLQTDDGEALRALVIVTVAQ
jgi:hypothetical protein